MEAKCMGWESDWWDTMLVAKTKYLENMNYQGVWGWLNSQGM